MQFFITFRTRKIFTLIDDLTDFLSLYFRFKSQAQMNKLFLVKFRNIDRVQTDDGCKSSLRFLAKNFTKPALNKDTKKQLP